jgi:DNA topoisomerase-1
VRALIAPGAPAELLVVESPAKALTLRRWLGPSWHVLATGGHLLDLPRSREGIDLSNGFEPTWELVRGRARTLSDLKRAARRVERVVLATDPDRDGEGIAWQLAAELGAEGGSSRVVRVLLGELTPEATHLALAHPVGLDRSRAEAHLARRVVDRLVGFRLSARLSSAIHPGLAAGRVQAAALRLAAGWLPARRPEAEGDGPSEPPPPFDTGTLLQVAARRLHLRPRRTMALAQRLYEGVEMGEGGRTGLLTYPRSGSCRIAPASLDWPPQRARGALLQAGGRDLPRLYALIWDRYLESRMAPECWRGLPAAPRRTPGPRLDRLDDASLLEALAAHGVGRPSTLAAIGESLEAHGYLTHAGGALQVTPLGHRVVAWLDRTFPGTLDAGYTARMESSLDEVEAGRRPWRHAVAAAWSPLERVLSGGFA